jgi:hypothetical protein
MMKFAERYMSDCPHCGRPIALPHRSPLATFGGQPDQPPPAGLINILCIERGLVFEYPLEVLRRKHVPTQGRDLGTDVMWRVESPCAHKNCSNPLTIYSWCRGDVSETEMLDSAIRATAKRHCGEHEFGWNSAKATVKKFDVW